MRPGLTWRREAATKRNSGTMRFAPDPTRPVRAASSRRVDACGRGPRGTARQGSPASCPESNRLGRWHKPPCRVKPPSIRRMTMPDPRLPPLQELTLLGVQVPDIESWSLRMQRIPGAQPTVQPTKTGNLIDRVDNGGLVLRSGLGEDRQQVRLFAFRESTGLGRLRPCTHRSHRLTQVGQQEATVRRIEVLRRSLALVDVTGPESYLGDCRIAGHPGTLRLVSVAQIESDRPRSLAGGPAGYGSQGANRTPQGTCPGRCRRRARVSACLGREPRREGASDHLRCVRRTGCSYQRVISPRLSLGLYRILLLIKE